MRRWVSVTMSGLLLLLLLFLLAGCATTPKIDWTSRVGSYTYDQAVMDFGPPQRFAKLSDGGTVAEWLTSRGYVYASSPFVYGYYPFWYGPFYPGYVDLYTAPNRYLRLIFDPKGILKDWRKFYR